MVYDENPLLLMIDLSTLSILVIVNIYVILALALLTFSVSELQAIDILGFAAASVRLGSRYQSGTGMVPKNLCLDRQLFQKSFNNEAQVNSDLSKKAVRMLESSIKRSTQ